MVQFVVDRLVQLVNFFDFDADVFEGFLGVVEEFSRLKELLLAGGQVTADGFVDLLDARDGAEGRRAADVINDPFGLCSVVSHLLHVAVIENQTVQIS